jgi:hypothetical protein
MIHVKATDALRRVLANTNLAYDDEGEVLHIATDDRLTLAMLGALVNANVEEVKASGGEEDDDADKLLLQARELQTAFWSALNALEAELGIEIDSTTDLEDVTVERLMEMFGKEED